MKKLFNPIDGECFHNLYTSGYGKHERENLPRIPEGRRRVALKILAGLSPGLTSLVAALLGTTLLYEALTSECGEISGQTSYAGLAAVTLSYLLAGCSGYIAYRVWKKLKLF